MYKSAHKIAAIDVGTNSFHLIIASINQRGMMNIISREKETVRLGSSSKDMKHIQPEAIKRGVNALKQFAMLARSENAEIKAVATSAVREAENRDVFLHAVKEETGIDIEVISGVEEGRLIYTGALHALPILKQKTLLIDIGGGSTETVIGLNGEIEYVHSAKLGTIRLSKQFFPDAKTTAKQVEKCRDYIKGYWSPIIKRIKETGHTVAVGTSGTILNLGIMTLAAKGSPIPDIINGLKIDSKELLNVIDKLTKAKTLQEKSALPGIDSSRADIILAGALILEHIVKEANIESLLISTYALREGIVFDTIMKQSAIEEFKHLSYLRYKTIYNLCHEYKVDLSHAEHVKKLAMQLFHDLEPLRKIDSTKGELLEAAALLHDVGYLISHDQHHKHSYYIISQCMMPGFTNDEAEVIANIARYHRKSHPKKKHPNFAVLSPEKQELVKFMSAILRIAEGIDRRQLQVINNLKAEIKGDEIKIILYKDITKPEPDIELWGANLRKLLLEETLGKKVSYVIE